MEQHNEVVFADSDGRNASPFADDREFQRRRSMSSPEGNRIMAGGNPAARPSLYDSDNQEPAGQFSPRYASGTEFNQCVDCGNVGPAAGSYKSSDPIEIL